MQKGIIDFRFLQTNWTKSLYRITLWVGLRRGKWWDRLWLPPFEIVLNSLKVRLLPKNRPRERRVGWRFFACIHWSFGRWFDDSGVCLLRARTKTTRKVLSASFMRVFHARGYDDHMSRKFFGSLWLDANDFLISSNFGVQKQLQERQTRSDMES